MILSGAVFLVAVSAVGACWVYKRRLEKENQLADQNGKGGVIGEDDTDEEKNAPSQMIEAGYCNSSQKCLIEGKDGKNVDDAEAEDLQVGIDLSKKLGKAAGDASTLSEGSSQN